MNHHLQFRPSRDLSTWVQGYHLFESDGFTGSHQAIAFPRHGLVINYGSPMWLELGNKSFPVDINLHGIFTRPWRCRWQDTGNYIAIELVSTTALYHLIRDNASLLTDKSGSVGDFGLPEDWKMLDSLRSPATTPASKIASVEVYLRRLIKGLPDPLTANPRLLVELEALKRQSFNRDWFDYSEIHLRREFVHHLGISPQKYRDIVRVQRACQYLASPVALSHCQIAHSLDFYDAAHFNKVFKRYTQLTPSQYRTQFSENPLDTINHIDLD